MANWTNSQMQSWLRKHSPDALYHVAPILNWDNAGPTLYWIVGRPDCDRTTAATIFWMSDPQFEAERIVAEHSRLEAAHNNGANIRKRILARWNSTGYREVGFGALNADIGAIANRYRMFVATASSGTDPLSLPQDLFDPLNGPIPDCPSLYDPRQNAELYDLLFSLGTDAGKRPGGAKAADARFAELKLEERINRERARHEVQHKFDVRNAWFGGVLVAISALLLMWALFR